MEPSKEQVEALKEAIRCYNENLCSQCGEKMKEAEIEITVVISCKGKTVSMLRTCSPSCMARLTIKAYAWAIINA